MQKYVLAFDYGSQSVRGVIFDEQGRILFRAKKDVPKYSRPQLEWAEADPTDYKTLTIEICQQLKAENEELFNQVAAIAVSSMRDCVAVVDENGEALRPMILWFDQRRTEKIRPENPLLRALTKLVGAERIVKENSQVGYTNYLRDHEPEIWNKAYKFVLLSGYLNRWLTGRFVDAIPNQPGHVPFDSKRMQWSGKTDIKHYVFPVEEEKLIDLVPSGTLMGPLCEQAQKDTGFGPMVQVVAAASDKACETLGVGCFDDTQCVLSFGSQATIQTVCDHYYELDPFVPSFPSAVPGLWNPEAQVYRGYWMVSWFLKEIEIANVQQQEHPEESFDYYLSQTPSGNDGLVLYPYMGASPKYPKSSGTIMGLRDYHGKSHIYRAMIEGINYTLRMAMEKIEKKQHTTIRSLKLTGGGSSSDIICQMTADMFNLETYVTEAKDTTSLGASIIGYVALGTYKTYQDAVEAMVRPSKTFRPIPRNVEMYQRYYSEYVKNIKARIHFGMFKSEDALQ